MATYVPFTPISIIAKAMFNFDAFGIANYRLSGTVKISGLTNKAIIKITDIEGNLVHEETSEGGTIEWDTTAFGKYKVASGVYMILISAQDGIETTVKKVMIIR